MADLNKALGSRVPTVGATVRRRAIADAFDRCPPRLVILAAPSGYGKTVLAAQLAMLSRAKRLVWLDGRGANFALDWLVRAFARAVDPPHEDSKSLEQHLLLPSESAQAGWASKLIADSCVVVDNVVVDDAEAALRDLECLLASSTPDSCFILTTRVLKGGVANRPDVWILEPDDLRLSDEEALDIASGLFGDSVDPVEIARIREACGGHAALFSVLLRHWQLRRPLSSRSLGASFHLSEELSYLAAADLQAKERRTLLAALLLGQGSQADLEHTTGIAVGSSELARIGECIPLIRVETPIRSRADFFAHELARAALCGFLLEKDSEAEVLLDRVQERLASRGDSIRALEVAIEYGDVKRLATWTERCGPDLVDCGSTTLLDRAISGLPVEALVQRPSLLLLQAQLLGSVGNTMESLQKARLAAELADYADDQRTRLSARLLLGRLLLLVGRASEARKFLEAAVAEEAAERNTELRSLLLAHLGMASTYLGDGASAEAQFAESGSQLASISLPARMHITVMRAYWLGSMRGAFDEVLALLTPAIGQKGLPHSTKLVAIHNACLALCFCGALGRAKDFLQALSREAQSAESGSWKYAHLEDWSAIAAGEGDYETAEALLSEAAAATEIDDETNRFALLVMSSIWKRASGNLERAFADSEAAREYFQAVEDFPLSWWAELESAANLLRLGDPHAASRIAARILVSVSSSGCQSHTLMARLVLAECLRARGELEDALAHVAQSADYLLSGNGNWITAMYIRAFPGLLGLVAKTVGPDRIPALLLRMILPENTEKALPMARDVLSEDEWGILARRLGVASEQPDTETPTTPTCRVRLFGGLEVEIAGRRITDAAWRKRKARLLFAMLVVRKGRDVPREQLLEYLWPDMDTERAVSNFYVVWNNMKNALCPNLPKGQALPYARTAGGVCRLDDLLVASDLDEFERALSEMRRAEAAGDAAAATNAAQRLIEVYRGDLLPGDIYDDWFAPLRERCRQEFGDAMQLAARLLEARGDNVGALQVVRAALSHDAWREDLYQSALRCQIASGQRSAAIDTYMTCMHKLSEDLGLDPSVETRKLYERVLAMETSAEEGYAV